MKAAVHVRERDGCTPPLVAGACECSDFTAGMTCERCRAGYHGNAVTGTPGDCRPCPCPGRTSCAEIAKTGQVVCTNCPAGQTGEMNLRLRKLFYSATAE